MTSPKHFKKQRQDSFAFRGPMPLCPMLLEPLNLTDSSWAGLVLDVRHRVLSVRKRTAFLAGMGGRGGLPLHSSVVEPPGVFYSGALVASRFAQQLYKLM